MRISIISPGTGLPVWVDTHACLWHWQETLFMAIGIGEKNYFDKDKEFFAVINVPYCSQISRMDIGKGKRRDPF